jgi:hypothetical protein
MLLFLAKSSACVVLVALNFYGTALLFQQAQLLKKLGQLLLLLALVLLLHFVLKRLLGFAEAAVPLLSGVLFQLPMLAGLPNKEDPKPLAASPFSGSFFWQRVSGRAIFFTWLFPAFISLSQVLTLFK